MNQETLNFSLAVVFVILQFIKIPINWNVFRIISKEKRQKRLEFKPQGAHLWWKRTAKEQEETQERIMTFLMCCLIFFWIKTPTSKRGKQWAWSVLIISLLQIGSLLWLAAISE